MNEFIQYVVTNGPTLFQAALMLIGAAALVAKLTPWTEDDRWVGRIQQVLNFIGLRAGYVPPSKK